MDAAVKEQTAEMSEANRQRNSIESAVDVPSPGIYAAQVFSMDKQKTLAEEQSTQASDSACFNLVEAVTLTCESYLRDYAGFEGFILWALADNNGCFNKPSGIDDSSGMERNDESYNSMIFEQPGRIEESGGMERNDKSYNSLNAYLNAFHKAGQATSFYKAKGIEEAVSAQNRKAARLVHIKRAKVVRPVHAKRTYHASHHEGHTSLRSSGWWANNWPRTRRSAVLHKSQLEQKYPTTGWKYATKGYRRHARSGDSNGCPQQPALDGEGDYRRKVPIDSVRRYLSHRAGANLRG